MKELVFVESVASGHGPLSIPIAKQCGYSVTFLTINPEFYRAWGVDDPLGAVDRLVVVDTDNVAAMAAQLDAGSVAGVVALDDFHLLVASELAARFALPHAAVEGLRNARLKQRTRALTSAGSPHRPAYQVFDIDRGLADSPVGYPCVIKPTDGTGSVGVRICADRAELATAIALFREKWHVVRGFQLSRQWLVEEYVHGNEYSAELVWHQGHWHLLGITEKILAAPPFCVEIGHVFPAALMADVQLAIAHQCSAWLQAIGLDFGAAHIEFRMSDDAPVLMEINPRLGGDMLPELIRLATGFEVLRHLFMQHTGAAAIADPRTARAAHTAAIRFLLAPHSGKIREIRGRALVESLPGISRCMLRPTPFEAMAAESSYDRLGYVIATGDSRQQALERVSAAIALLDIVYT